MPKKGAKSGTRKKQNAIVTTRDTPFATDGQIYGKVTKLLGSCRMRVACLDGVERLAHVRGALQKRAWVAVHDVVLVSLRAFQDAKGDIVYKYNSEEVHTLKRAGEIPETMTQATTNDKPSHELGVEDAGFVFTDVDVKSNDTEVDIDAI